MPLAITGLYASLLALVFFVLTIGVVKQRRANAVSLGDGTVDELQKAIRAHGNFIEYVPICLILLAIAELNTNLVALLHVAGAVLLAGRLLHAYGIVKSSGASKPRIYGMLCTFLVMLVLSLWNLFSIIFW
ncbi:MAPEG family protein [Glaciecola sp. 2405UD65-10]|uniref:MAPEG family protein n=1 Tax=Glaciecola sp. 2405UD65-10 TaxID=3397244 RepID=UPI003B5B5A3B